MYWPCGVPRIHAYGGTENFQNDIEDDHGQSEADQRYHEVDEKEESTSKDRSSYTGETGRSISDLRVARLDHLFVTISTTCLTVWSSRVCEPLPRDGLTPADLASLPLCSRGLRVLTHRSKHTGLTPEFFCALTRQLW